MCALISSSILCTALLYCNISMVARMWHWHTAGLYPGLHSATVASLRHPCSRPAAGDSCLRSFAHLVAVLHGLHVALQLERCHGCVRVQRHVVPLSIQPHLVLPQSL